MALTFRSHSISTGVSADSMLAVSVPAGTTDGDLMTMIAMSDIGVSELTVLGTGWTSQESEADTAHSSGMWTHIASSEPSLYTVTHDQAADQGFTAYMVSADPAGGGVQIDATSGNKEAASVITTTSVTALADGFFLAGFTNDDALSIDTAPAGTVVGAATTNGSGVVSLYYQDGVGAGGITDEIVWSGADNIHAYAITASAVVLSDETLTATAGSFTWTGTAMVPTVGVTVLGDPGVYAFTGFDADPATQASVLPTVAGSYSVTGTVATLGKTAYLGATAGSYAVTGVVAGLIGPNIADDAWVQTHAYQRQLVKETKVRPPVVGPGRDRKAI